MRGTMPELRLRMKRSSLSTDSQKHARGLWSRYYTMSFSQTKFPQERRGNIWELTINVQRWDIRECLLETPRIKINFQNPQKFYPYKET